MLTLQERLNALQRDQEKKQKQEAIQRYEGARAAAGQDVGSSYAASSGLSQPKKAAPVGSSYAASSGVLKSEEQKAQETRIQELGEASRELPLPSGMERVGLTLSGAGKQYAGSMAQTGATAVDTLGIPGILDLVGRFVTPQRAKTYNPAGDALLRLLTAPMEKRIVDTAQSAADKWSTSGAKDVERAREGLDPMGKTMVNVGVGASQMAADYTGALLTGGSSMIFMAARAFGSGVQEARAKGYDERQQLALGLTGAATEYLTEKLFGGNPVYDKDIGLVNRLVWKVTHNEKVMKILTSLPVDTLTEGAEEIISDLVNPLAEWAITGNRPEYELDQIIEDGAVGVLTALLAKGGQAVGNAVLPGKSGNSSPSETERQQDPLLEALLGPRKTTPAFGKNPGSAETATGEITAPGVENPGSVDSTRDTGYNDVVNPEKVSTAAKVMERLARGEDVPLEEIYSVPEIAEVDRQAMGPTSEISTPERDQLRKDVLNKLLARGSYTGVEQGGEGGYNGQIRQERRADIVIGVPAAGKSSVLVNPLSQQHGSRVIDSDMAKELLPEYDGGRGASAVHRESSMIRDSLLEEATVRGDNLVWPQVGSDLQKLMADIQGLKSAGYQVYLHLNELPAGKAAGRAINRFLTEGRYIDPGIVMKAGDSPTRNYETIRGIGGLLDGYSRYSNDVPRGTDPRFVESSEGGEGASPAASWEAPGHADPGGLRGGREDGLGGSTASGEADPGQTGARTAGEIGLADTGDGPVGVGAAADGFTVGPEGRSRQERTSRLADGVLSSTQSRREAAGGISRQQWNDRFRYRVQSEAESLQYATEQLYYMVDGNETFLMDVAPESFRALTEELKAAPGWNGVMTDMAVMIATELEGRSANYQLGEDVYLDWVDTMRRKATETGRGTQAWAKWTRVLRDMSPEYRLELIDRSLSRYAGEHDISGGLTLSDKVRGAFLGAETEEARDAAIADMQREIAGQLPTTWMDKWNAIRYLNMLGNFRTQGRNVIGNVGMQAMTKTKNAIATALESIVSTLSGGKLERTKAVAGSDLRRAAGADFETVREAALGGGKYSLDEGRQRSDAEGILSGAMEQRRIFKTAPLEGYRKVTDWAMEKGDEIFSKAAYTDALAGWLKANGVTAEEFSSEEWKNRHRDTVDRAREYAVKEAQEATFRDTNWFSGWISKAGRRGDTPGIVRGLSEGLMPFRKTPANVAVRAEEYSPLGLVNTAVLAARKAAGNGDITGGQIIDQLSKSLTGTGIFLLGMGLRDLGLLRGGGGDDEDENQAYFDDLNGHQPYSFETPEGQSYTLDWLSPGAIPLFMGAAFQDGMERGGFQLSDIEGAVSVMAEPMLEMSMLSGVRDALDGIRYSDNSTLQMLGTLVVSYATQGLTNSLLGQLERSAETERKSTYIEHDSPVPSWLQREIGRVSAKTPGWDYQQIPYINAWGETEQSGDPLERTLVNTLSPGYTSHVEEGAVEKELQRLADSLDKTSLFPDNAKRSFQVDGETKYLTADEYVEYATAKGKESRRMVEALMGSAEYKALSDEQKAEAIQKAYEWANAQAKGKVSGYTPSASSWLIKAKMAVDAGIPIEEYVILRFSLDADGNGSVTQKEAKAALDGKDLSREQKGELWEIINSSWKSNPYRE